MTAEPLETYDLMQELSLLELSQTRLWLDEHDELWLRVGDNDAVGPVTVQRAFPLSTADEFLSLKDRQGNEVGVVRRLVDLDADSRDAVMSHLQWSYFCSTITSVHSIENRYHVPHWDVQTDKGRRVFELHSSRRDIRVLPRGRALVRDADGNVYLIPAVTELDPKSRAILEDYV